jgi:hypothetical protein
VAVASGLVATFGIFLWLKILDLDWSFCFRGFGFLFSRHITILSLVSWLSVYIVFPTNLIRRLGCAAITGATGRDADSFRAS